MVKSHRVGMLPVGFNTPKKPHKVVDSAFYCAAKLCRKTAWHTPEYLTDEDKEIINTVITAAHNNDRALFDSIINEDFFNRIIGWPEGKTYYLFGLDSYRTFAWEGLKKHSLKRLDFARASNYKTFDKTFDFGT